MDADSVREVEYSAPCPFLAVLNSGESYVCWSCLDDQIAVSRPYAEAYCVSAAWAECSLYIHAAAAHKTPTWGGSQSKRVTDDKDTSHTSPSSASKAVPIGNDGDESRLIDQRVMVVEETSKVSRYVTGERQSNSGISQQRRDVKGVHTDTPVASSANAHRIGADSLPNVLPSQATLREVGAENPPPECRIAKRITGVASETLPHCVTAKPVEGDEPRQDFNLPMSSVALSKKEQVGDLSVQLASGEMTVQIVELAAYIGAESFGTLGCSAQALTSMDMTSSASINSKDSVQSGQLVMTSSSINLHETMGQETESTCGQVDGNVLAIVPRITTDKADPRKRQIHRYPLIGVILSFLGLLLAFLVLSKWGTNHTAVFRYATPIYPHPAVAWHFPPLRESSDQIILSLSNSSPVSASVRVYVDKKDGTRTTMRVPGRGEAEMELSSGERSPIDIRATIPIVPVQMVINNGRVYPIFGEIEPERQRQDG